METKDRKTEVKDEDKHKDKDKRKIKPYGPEYQERYEVYRAGSCRAVRRGKIPICINIPAGIMKKI